jgi:hypothetical protein
MLSSIPKNKTTARPKNKTTARRARRSTAGGRVAVAGRVLALQGL